MGNTLWRTPEVEFLKWHALFGFTVDAAASENDALLRPSDSVWAQPGEVCDPCANTGRLHVVGRYISEAEDGRKAEHYQPHDRVYCNPPYKHLLPWLKVARETSRYLEDVLWCLLLPVSTDTRWFHRYCYDERLQRPREGVELRFLPYRIPFDPPPGQTAPGPRAPSLVVIFHPREESSRPQRAPIVQGRRP